MVPERYDLLSRIDGRETRSVIRRGVAIMGRPLPFRLILASGSLGRRELLKLHGYDFEVRPSNIPEPTEARLGDCRHYVGELAWLKSTIGTAKPPAARARIGASRCAGRYPLRRRALLGLVPFAASSRLRPSHPALRPNTSVGTLRLVSVPSPSEPSAFQPQHFTVPSDSTAQE